jgi:3-deoxy-7-phosphoheptulonate synthase
MITSLSENCTLAQKAAVIRFLEGSGIRLVVHETSDGCRIGVFGEGNEGLAQALRAMPGVAEVLTESPGTPLVSRGGRTGTTPVAVGSALFDGQSFPVIAGPCSVESADQILAAAEGVALHGASALRGGAFKPRTSPYSFQGLGAEGLELLVEARRQTGLPIVTEVVAPEDVELVSSYADVLQIGARNMQNFRLLQAAGEQPRTVLLKRGMCATLEELLGAAEYIMSAGNPRVILCERGIRSFGRHTRNTLDIGAIPVLKQRTHLPVIVDPSHAAGLREIVPALASAAIAAGADGLIVEVHPQPDQALSDGRQSLDVAGFGNMMEQLRVLAGALGRVVSSREAA